MFIVKLSCQPRRPCPKINLLFLKSDFNFLNVIGRLDFYLELCT